MKGNCLKLMLFLELGEDTGESCGSSCRRRQKPAIYTAEDLFGDFLDFLEHGGEYAVLARLEAATARNA
jgi:hypothetical protein